MTYCDSIAASSPYLQPRQTERERRLTAARELGLSVEDCPRCGGDAVIEPPLLVSKHGYQLTTTMIRCPECGPFSVYSPTEKETDVTKESDKICPCGCGKPVSPGNKYNSKGCSGRARFTGVGNPKRSGRARFTGVGNPKRPEPPEANPVEPVQEPEPVISVQYTWGPDPLQLLESVRSVLRSLPREVRLAVVELVNAEEDILQQMGAR